MAALFLFKNFRDVTDKKHLQNNLYFHLLQIIGCCFRHSMGRKRPTIIITKNRRGSWRLWRTAEKNKNESKN